MKKDIKWKIGGVEWVGWISFLFFEVFRMIRLPILTVIRFPIFKITNLLLLSREMYGLLQRAKVSDTWVVEVNGNLNGFWSKLRDAIPTILVYFGWGMRPVL